MCYAYYDTIGNCAWSVGNADTNAYSANGLNQYTSVLRVSAPPRETVPGYDADGNLVSLGPWAYAYDAANRLVSVSSNGTPLVASSYDWRSRRVRKTTPEATYIFTYDDWNLVEERIAYTNGTTSTIHYYWGKDLSGTLQDAGGIGGLLYLTVDGSTYVPLYDANGNVTRYLDASGRTVAEYVYDAFGNFLSQSGPLADAFRFRFSTKYFDMETGLYYYGYRFYSPALRRWLTRDPIEEEGGENLYAFCGNNAIISVDPHGHDRYMTTFSLNPREDRWHVGVAVDTWKCAGGRWRKTGVATFDFGVDSASFLNRLGTYFVAQGAITEREGNVLETPFTIMSTPEQDIEMLRRIRAEQENPPLYSFFFNNCIHWSDRVIGYDMEE